MATPNPTTQLNRRLTAAQVAEEFNINVRTLYRLVRLGRVPAFRVGDRQFRFDRTEIEAHFRANVTRIPPSGTGATVLPFSPRRQARIITPLSDATATDKPKGDI